PDDVPAEDVQPPAGSSSFHVLAFEVIVIAPDDLVRCANQRIPLPSNFIRHHSWFSGGVRNQHPFPHPTTAGAYGKLFDDRNALVDHTRLNRLSNLVSAWQAQPGRFPTCLEFTSGKIPTSWDRWCFPTRSPDTGS